MVYGDWDRDRKEGLGAMVIGRKGTKVGGRCRGADGRTGGCGWVLGREGEAGVVI